jgi:hypothetical protein
MNMPVRLPMAIAIQHHCSLGPRPERLWAGTLALELVEA